MEGFLGCSKVSPSIHGSSSNCINLFFCLLTLMIKLNYEWKTKYLLHLLQKKKNATNEVIVLSTVGTAAVIKFLSSLSPLARSWTSQSLVLEYFSGRFLLVRNSCTKELLLYKLCNHHLWIQVQNLASQSTKQKINEARIELNYRCAISVTLDMFGPDGGFFVMYSSPDFATVRVIALSKASRGLLFICCTIWV